MSERLLYSLAEAAAITGIGEPRLREEIKAGRLPAAKVGRRWAIRPADLEALAQPEEDPRTEVIEAAVELVRRTTEAQDLPAQVDDPPTLRRIASALRAFTPGSAA